ncbi:MAG: type II and III secretion system protein family protein [Devosia sp.]
MASQSRLALIAALIVPALLVAAAAPARAQTVNYDLATTSVMKINLPVSQAVTVVVSDAVAKVVAADPTIADAQPITDRSIYVIGKGFGTTTVNLYSAAGTPVGLLAVQVGADTPAISRAISAAVPGSKVKVSSVNGRILLSGSVGDSTSMQKVLDVVAQFGSPGVVNTVTLSGGQQVNLEVRILEAQRDANRQLGISWEAQAGGAKVGYVDGGIGNTLAPAGDASTFSGFAANVINVPGFSLTAFVNAMETKGLVRTLADPNLTTLSGVSASFLAGGQVPIRTYDDNNHVTLNYKDFGVKLVFTPVVLSGGRIQIHLTPEVSSVALSPDSDPLFTTRNLDATVELRDGQSFSVAGLLQNETVLSQNQLPWLGDVPVLGSLFKSSSFRKHDTELVVIVTPRLVQPSGPGQPIATPLDQTRAANDPEFFALGQMEVTPKMIKSVQSGAGVSGPYGYIIDLDGGS